MLLLCTASEILVIFSRTHNPPIFPKPNVSCHNVLSINFSMQPLDFCDSIYFNWNRKVVNLWAHHQGNHLKFELKLRSWDAETVNEGELCQKHCSLLMTPLFLPPELWQRGLYWLKRLSCCSTAFPYFVLCLHSRMFHFHHRYSLWAAENDWVWLHFKCFVKFTFLDCSCFINISKEFLHLLLHFLPTTMTLIWCQLYLIVFSPSNMALQLLL